MADVFSPATPLEHAIRAGDYTGTLAILRQLTASERQSHRASVCRINKLLDALRWNSQDYGTWGIPPTPEQQRAVRAALVVCGTTKDVADTYVDIDDLIALGQEFQPICLKGLAEAKLKLSPYTIDSVQKLIVAGLVPRPDGEEYTIGLMCLPRSNRVHQAVDQVFVADPGLLHILLRVMEVEGTSECSLAAIDKYSRPEDTWSYMLRKLCAQGIYSRETLLDKTLSTLERDWPQFRSGWFSRFHAELEPDLAMMAPHAHRYLALCHSRIPPTAAMALGVIKQLDNAGLLDTEALFDAMRPLMASSIKGQVEAALKLIDARVKREPSRAEEASALIAMALAHESGDVQKKILQRLTQWGVDDGLRHQLHDFQPGIAAVNRPALELLLGASPSDIAKDRNATLPHRDIAAPQSVSVLDPSRRLSPIQTTDELVECIAYVFENDTDIDTYERASAALAQAAPISDMDAVRFAPVIKRAGKVRKPMGQALARLLLFVADGNRIDQAPAIDFYGHPNPAQEELTSRIDDWMDFAALGTHLPPLSAPTHQRGFIDPALLVERIQAHHACGATSTRLEQIRALLRLATQASDDARNGARQLADTPFNRALRYALGDDIVPDRNEIALFAAAARIRHPEEDDLVLADFVGDLGPDGPLAARYASQVHSRSTEVEQRVYTHHYIALKTAPAPERTSPELLAIRRHSAALTDDQEPWYGHWSFGGGDEGLLRYSATVLPSSLEAHFADGVRAIGNNLDWWQAQRHDKVYLDRLLDPTVIVGPNATLLLALGLAAKEPGQNAIAVDALVQCHAEGRLDVPLLATTMRDLLNTALVKSARYAKSLKKAIQADAEVASVVFELLGKMLEANPESPPRDTAMLLELLQEVSLAMKYSLSAQIRTSIGALKLASKGRTLQQALLAQL